MNFTALEEVAEQIDYGVTASATELPDGPKFLRITDIQNDVVDWNTVPFAKASSKEIQNKSLRSGDIVFARTGATTGKSYLIRKCPANSVFASYLIRVRPGPAIDPAYLSHFFKSPFYWAQIASKIQGAAQPGVNSTKLKQLQIPLPPLPEQKRIAAILDQADALRRLRQRAIDRLNDLSQSIFYEIFLGVNIKSEALSNIVLNVQIGPFGSLLHKADYVNGGVPVLNPTHIKDGALLEDPSFSVCEKKNGELQRYHLKAGQILMGRRGEMGRCAVVDSKHEGMICGTGSLIIEPNDKVVKSDYLSFYLRTPLARRRLENAASGVTMLNLNSKSLNDVLVPVPSLVEQERFSGCINQIEESRKQLNQDARMVAELFQSLQQSAFRGELQI